MMKDVLTIYSPFVSEVITNLVVLPFFSKQISAEVKPTEDTIVMDEKDETRDDDKEENAADNILTSSHQTTTNEETDKPDESLEHISGESTPETAASRDVTPEIEINDVETKTLTTETDNMDIEKIEDEEEAKVGAYNFICI
jgi:hypothetical protein